MVKFISRCVGMMKPNIIFQQQECPLAKFMITCRKNDK